MEWVHLLVSWVLSKHFGILDAAVCCWVHYLIKKTFAALEGGRPINTSCNCFLCKFHTLFTRLPLIGAVSVNDAGIDQS